MMTSSKKEFFYYTHLLFPILSEKSIIRLIKNIRQSQTRLVWILRDVFPQTGRLLRMAEIYFCATSSLTGITWFCLIPACSAAAFTNATNKGCGRVGRDKNSG